MPACPSAEQVARYQRYGYLFPIDCLTPDEVRYNSGCLDPFEREQWDAFGRDEYGSLDLEPRAACNCDPASRAAHAFVVGRYSDPTN